MSVCIGDSTAIGANDEQDHNCRGISLALSRHHRIRFRNGSYRILDSRRHRDGVRVTREKSMTPNPRGYPRQSALCALSLGIRKSTRHWSWRPRRQRKPKLNKWQRKLNEILGE